MSPDMTRRPWILAVLLFLLGGMVLLNGTVGLRLLEMQGQFQRDRFLNFELSSRLLIVRMYDLVGQRRGMRDEISAGVLESRVLNQIENDLRSLTLLEKMSLAAINAVRVVSLKPALNIASGPASIKVLVLAFYFERTRHYESALRVYSTFLKQMKPTSDSRAFAMLHLGFCYVVMGDIEEALRLLETVRSEYSASHFGETADILIKMILQGDIQVKQIEKGGGSDLLKARQLATIGRCKSALEYFERVSQRDQTEGDRLLRAACRERMGQKKNAFSDYVELIKTGSPTVRREASHRLAIAAEFHGAGNAARRYAMAVMAADGDSEGIESIEDGAVDRRRDLSGFNGEEDLPEDVRRELAAVRKEADTLQEEGLYPSGVSVVRPTIPSADNFDISVDVFGRGVLRLHSAVLDSADLEGESGAVRLRVLLPEIRSITPGSEGQRLRIFLRGGASFASQGINVDSERGLYDETLQRWFPPGEVVRVMGERQ